MGLAVLLHVIATVIWVGGMFFAHMVLRPVTVEQLEPPARLALWAGVFGRFFPWVWISIAVLLATGFWIIFSIFGGFANIGMYVHLMTTTGLIMVAIFGHIYFAPFKRLKAAVAAEDWPTAGVQLAQIRLLVTINLVIGLITTAIASGGRYLLT